MSHAFVADASVAIAWVHPAQATKDSAAMVQAVAAGACIEVPALWPLEAWIPMVGGQSQNPCR